MLRAGSCSWEIQALASLQLQFPGAWPGQFARGAGSFHLHHFPQTLPGGGRAVPKLPRWTVGPLLPDSRAFLGLFLSDNPVHFTPRVEVSCFTTHPGMCRWDK